MPPLHSAPTISFRTGLLKTSSTIPAPAVISTMCKYPAGICATPSALNLPAVRPAIRLPSDVARNQVPIICPNRIYHEQHQQRPHPVIAEPLPHLCEEERVQPSRMFLSRRHLPPRNLSNSFTHHASRITHHVSSLTWLTRAASAPTRAGISPTPLPAPARPRG